MGCFIDDDFLLDSNVSKTLYHEYAENLPIIDFHNHLDPMWLSANHRCVDIAELWLDNDPYKHRAMRIMGIPETYITGKEVAARERFDKWASCVPGLVGNPLFHWTCLELKRFFGIDEMLCGATARDVWDKCNGILSLPRNGVLDILKRMGVEVLCTSDDVLSDVSLHRRATLASGGIKVLPSLRADSITSFSADVFPSFLKRLSESSGIDVGSLDDYLQAIEARLDVFEAAGCRYADHSFDSGFKYFEVGREEASDIFRRLLMSGPLTREEDVRLRSYLIRQLGESYARRDWVMLLHIGAMRFTNSRLRRICGPAGGYASIGSACDMSSLAALLDSLDRDDVLPRTILFTLNPSDNAAFATLTGSYPGAGVKGKVQFGPAWWYNDHLEGILGQLQTLSSYGVLSGFVGMTTDSRSVLSFSRHEYFRRILCRFMGEKVSSGEFPDDIPLLGGIVKDICYDNIKNWNKRDDR